MSEVRFGISKPFHKPRHRRKCDETFQLWEFLLKLLGDTFDQEIAEGDAGKPGLAVRDRIEDGSARLMRRHRLPVNLKHRFDGAGNVGCKRDLNEYQRLFRH